MLFGLRNVPSTFKRMMDSVPHWLKWSTCLCYLVDVVVFPPNFDERLSRPSNILFCLQEANLTLKHKKAALAKQNSVYSVISAQGVKPDPKKNHITNFPIPRSVKRPKSVCVRLLTTSVLLKTILTSALPYKFSYENLHKN